MSVVPGAVTTGVLLAAGAGRRMGMPKALVDDWLQRSVGVLADGGCQRVTVVLGASADEARLLLEETDVDIVVADDWADGMGASLRAGLGAMAPDVDALVHLVDLPDVTPEVVARVLACGARLARASYDDRVGHPVLIGSEHRVPLMGTLSGDVGAKGYLESHDVLAVECGDLATGRDQDRR